MLYFDNRHLIGTRDSRVSRAPPHHTLPAFLNLNGSFFEPYDGWFQSLTIVAPPVFEQLKKLPLECLKALDGPYSLLSICVNFMNQLILVLDILRSGITKELIIKYSDFILIYHEFEDPRLESASKNVSMRNNFRQGSIKIY